MLTLRQVTDRCFAFCAGLLGAASQCEAGAWLQPEGRTQIIFSNAASSAKQRFTRNKTGLSTERFSKQEMGIRAERGFNETIAFLAIARVEHVSLTSMFDERHSITSIGGLGVKAKLWSSDNWMLSAQVLAQIGTERRLPREVRAAPSPHDAEVRMNLGRNIDLLTLPAFVDLQAAYRWRGGKAADELRFDATLGVRPMPRLLLLLQSFNTVVVAGRTRFRQHKLQPSIVYELTDRWSIQIGAFATVAGRETVKERGGLAAMWWRF